MPIFKNMDGILVEYTTTQIMGNNCLGVGKPDGETITVDADGTLHANVSGSGGATNTKYYETYEEFQAEYNAGKINPETLILIKNDDNSSSEVGNGGSTPITPTVYTLNVTLGSNMTLDSSTDQLSQTPDSKTINSIVINANSGYYFPIDYALSQNGINVVRNSYSQITISGTLTDNTNVTLPDCTQKDTQDAPVGLTGDVGVINGTTTDMEYADSPTASTWITCDSGSTTVEDGTWYIRYKATDTKETSAYVSINVKPEPTVKIVTFAEGTDEEIAAMVQAHYNDEINIADYWAVGDKRSVNLSAMSATGVGESHRAQTVQFAIADFEKDELSTAINGHTKAAITLTQVDCLMDAECEAGSKYGENDTEKGYINSTATNYYDWRDSSRRGWCNNVYFNALPTTIKNAVKEVRKNNWKYTTLDKVFLLSEIEVIGEVKQSSTGQGIQYSYYEIIGNRYKKPIYASESNSQAYWYRSARPKDSISFCYCGSDGSSGYLTAYIPFGIAPCFCM